MSILAKIPDASGCGMTKKWVPRPLVTVCGVCSSPATDVQHYGSVSCYSCRAFFRRSVGTGKDYQVCARGSEDCVLDPVNRTNCKKCRFRKCLEIGMMPEKVDRTARRRTQRTSSGKNEKQQKPPLAVETDKTNVSLFDEDSGLSFILDPGEDVDADLVAVGDATSPVDSAWLRLISSSLGSQPVPPSLSSPSSLPNQPSPSSLPSEPSPTGWTVRYLRPAGVNCSDLADISNESHPESSNSEHSGINIESLVDDCFAEEILKESEIMTICPAPLLDLTFEEEFKIHQLVVMRENILYKTFQHLSLLPGFHANIRSFVSAIMEERRGVRVLLPIHLLEILFERMPRQFDQMAKHMGLDLLEEFVSLDMATKEETIRYGLPILQICMKSYIQANTDKKYFVKQHIAAGNFHQGFREAFESAVPGGKHTLYLLKSFDPCNLYIFTSPWAFNYEDEVKFEMTMTALGGLVKEDVQLGTLFMFLVLMSPGGSTSPATRNNAQMERMRQELVLLIYRYLRTKHQSANHANLIASRLLSLLEDLHECREIHLHRRITRLHDDLPGFEELLKTPDFVFPQNC